MKALKSFYGKTQNEKGVLNHYNPGDEVHEEDCDPNLIKRGFIQRPEKKAAPKKSKKEGKPPGAKK